MRDCWAESLFKSQNDGTIDKTEVVCSICQAEFSYHRGSSSLSYHLNAKHINDLTCYRRGAPLCLAYIPCLTVREHEKNTIKQQCLKYTLSEVITRKFIRFSL